MQRKKILITGASSGLGLSHAIYLTYKGYKVIGTSRRASELEPSELKEKYIRDHTKFKYIDKDKTKIKPVKILAPKTIIEQFNSLVEKIQFANMDITENESVKQSITKILSEGPIDVLINNAGIGYFGPIEELSLKIAYHQFEVNFFGHIRVIKSVLPSMRARKEGLIINTASMAGVTCIPFQSLYSASKAAIMRLSESLRLELRPFNVYVSTLVPGDINTPFDANTVKLHKKDTNFQSHEIEDMITNIPVSETSAYFGKAKIAWATIIQNLIDSPPPIVTSKTVERIIKKRNPKIHYRSGSKLQTIGVSLAQRIMPENTFIKLVSKFYGL
ncbi:MAG: SDR family oxidoreductase [Candidatus Hodarchaeales archaeon]